MTTPPASSAESAPVVKLQLSGNIIGPVIAILVALVSTIMYVSSRTSRSDVKEIVNDRLQVFEQQNKEIMTRLDELKYEIRNAEKK